jgi:hypothetical protein
MADNESVAQQISNCVTTARASMDAACRTPDAPIHFARGARVRLRDPNVWESNRTGTVIGILPGDDTRLRVRWDGSTGLRTVVEARLDPSQQTDNGFDHISGAGIKTRTTTRYNTP